MTNFEKIKQMSVEEMATFLYCYKECSYKCLVSKGCKDCRKRCETEISIKEWLESEVQEDE